jgi:hypothetical protein
MFPIAIGVILLTVASILITKTNTANKASTKTEVKSIITVPPGPTEISSETPSPSPAATASPTKTPTPADPSPAVSNNSTVQYPNSVRIDNNVFTSTDDPDIITNWYKEKIQNMNMNVRNFVSTKTNGNVLNKLEGADGQSEIKIEITKPSDSSTVKIVIQQ